MITFNCSPSKISVLTTQDEVAEALSEGIRGTAIADETPSDATMGGLQEGHTGLIKTEDGVSFALRQR